MHVGSQSIVAVLDVRKRRIFGPYEVFTHNGSRSTGFEPGELARRAEVLGAGEVLLNSIDNDGTLKGYDFSLIDIVRPVVRLPITVLGGAGSLDDIRSLFSRYGVIGAAAGSLFVFKGKYRAVLIQYPLLEEKKLLYSV